jgi:hypothetical protein
VYVFVRPRNSKRVGFKKVIAVHKNAAAFYTSIQKILGLAKPVRCLLRDDFTVIDSLDELTDNMHILASHVDPEFERKWTTESVVEEPQPEHLQSGSLKPFRNPLAPVNFESSRPSPSRESVQPSPAPSRPPASMKRAMSFKAAAPEPRRLPSVISSVDDRRSESRDALSSALRSKKAGSIFSRTLSSDSDDEAKQPSSPAEGRPRSAFLQSVLYERDVGGHSKHVKISIESKTDAELFRELLAELLPKSVPQCVDVALAQIPKERRLFTEAAHHREGELLYLWIHAAAQQPLMTSVAIRPCNDPMMIAAANFFKNHRHVACGFPTFRFRTLVVGPPRSGKSSLLVNCAGHFLCELAAHRLWKSTFVFVLDVKTIAELIPDPQRLYRAMLELVLNAAGQQKPVLRFEMAKIRKQLESVCEDRPPVLTKHSYPEVDSLANHLNICWRDSAGFDAWYTNVFALPEMFAIAVGYRHVAMFLDNIDAADIEITRFTHFRKAPNSLAIEYVKHALSRTDFMVAGGSARAPFSSMLPVDSDGVDCLEGVDFLSTCGVVTDLGSRDKMRYAVDVKEEPQPVVITVNMCAGAAPYIAAWDQLNIVMYRLDSARTGTPFWNDMYYDVLNCAQSLVSLLFVCLGSKKITVTAVRRHFDAFDADSTVDQMDPDRASRY